MQWDALGFDESGVARCFRTQLAEPLRSVAHRTIDVPAIALGMLPFVSASSSLVRAYRDVLFGDAQLRDLPGEPEPTFIFNATNLQTGAVWTFSRGRMGDDSVGYIRDPDVSLSTAVAASSAYPPLLSPVSLELEGQKWIGMCAIGTILCPQYVPTEQISEFRRHVLLVDGGVADNLGVESSMELDLLVSDAGAATQPISAPALNWFSQFVRVFDIIFEQPDPLRLMIVDRDRKVVSWSSRDELRPDSLGEPRWVFAPGIETDVLALATEPTRLRALPDVTQKRLVNWGYLSAAQALHSVAGSFVPVNVPYCDVGLGERSGPVC
jgi:NTE family protein